MELNVHLLIKIQFSTPKLIYNISELWGLLDLCKNPTINPAQFNLKHAARVMDSHSRVKLSDKVTLLWFCLIHQA